MDVIVLAPELRVLPASAIVYPNEALVLALITLVPVLVRAGLKIPRLTALPVILAQLVPLVPTQKISDSGMIPETVISLVVTKSTTPPSIGEPVVSMLA